MTANTSPIFTLTPKNGYAKATAADATQDGTNANVVSGYTAGANGSFVLKLMCQPISTSGSTTTNAAALRIYINNGSTIGTASNNILIKEVTLPATAVNQTGTAEAIGIEVPLNIQLQASYVLAFGVTSFAANTQWNICTIVGDY
jgi:hypothetical protein